MNLFQRESQIQVINVNILASYLFHDDKSMKYVTRSIVTDDHGTVFHRLKSIVELTSSQLTAIKLSLYDIEGQEKLPKDVEGVITQQVMEQVAAIYKSGSSVRNIIIDLTDDINAVCR